MRCPPGARVYVMDDSIPCAIPGQPGISGSRTHGLTLGFFSDGRLQSQTFYENGICRWAIGYHITGGREAVGFWSGVVLPRRRRPVGARGGHGVLHPPYLSWHRRRAARRAEVRGALPGHPGAGPGQPDGSAGAPEEVVSRRLTVAPGVRGENTTSSPRPSWQPLASEGRGSVSETSPCFTWVTENGMRVSAHVVMAPPHRALDRDPEAREPKKPSRRAQQAANLHGEFCLRGVFQTRAPPGRGNLPFRTRDGCCKLTPPRNVS